MSDVDLKRETPVADLRARCALLCHAGIFEGRWIVLAKQVFEILYTSIFVILHIKKKKQCVNYHEQKSCFKCFFGN